MAKTLKQLALQMRPMIQQAANSLSDNEALKAVNLFPKWVADKTYETGVRVRYNNVLYRCLHYHTSRETWNPEASNVIWERVVATEQPEEIIEEWDTNKKPYSKGSKVIYNGDTWESTVNNNIWTPGIYGWNKI